MTDKPIFIEDSIMQEGQPATAGSRILQGFHAPFDAAVVERLIRAGYTLQSEPPSAEFGCPPFAGDPPPSKAVAAVFEGRSDFALCNDYAGYNRRQAAEKGLYYLHPTYGTVSRYGLIPAVSSMDTIGLVCRDWQAGFRLLSLLAGHDPRDGVSQPDASCDTAAAETPVIRRADENLTRLFPLISPVAAILTAAELSNNINRYDGLRFGYRPAQFKGIGDLYCQARTQGFGLQPKLALVMGAMVLSEGFYEKRYHKAMQIRRLLRETADRLTANGGVLSLPLTEAAGAWLPALCGMPSVTLSHNGETVCLMAGRMHEAALRRVLEGGLPA